LTKLDHGRLAWKIDLVVAQRHKTKPTRNGVGGNGTQVNVMEQPQVKSKFHVEFFWWTKYAYKWGGNTSQWIFWLSICRYFYFCIIFWDTSFDEDAPTLVGSRNNILVIGF